MENLFEKTQSRILIVDDTPKNVQLIGTILREKSFLVSIAESGTEALKILEHTLPDLILLDIMMPEMNGFETCRLLKQNEKTKDIPVIFLSALSDTVDKVEGFSVGAVDYVTKPVQSEELLARINAHLTIRTLFKKLENINEELESIVEERTKELEKTKAYLLNVINSMPSILIGVNAEGKITHWNKAAEYTTRKNEKEATGKCFWEIFTNLEKYQDIYFDVVHSKKEAVFAKEVTVGEEPVYNNISIFPLVNNGTEGAVIRIDNVTELEKKEDMLRRAQKMEMVGTLAGGLAHDFNNILGGMLGAVSLIKFKIEKYKTIDFNELKNYIDAIEQCGENAKSLVRQLLSLSRKHEVETAPVNLNKSLKHIAKVCENTLDKSISFSVEYYGEDAVTMIDPVQIEQAILNLCINAAHSMTIMRKKGEIWGGRLKISLEKVYVEAGLIHVPDESESGFFWKISVQDTGVGMTKSTIEKIFMPFFTTKEDRGTGLGLTMVYNIAKQHKGLIDVISEFGFGSTFRLYFPVAEIETNKPLDHELFYKLSSGRGRVLVVDDDIVIRTLTQQMLLEIGFQVDLAEDGAKAIKIYSENFSNIDAVILDLVMPGMSGYDVFVKLKSINPEIKVLLTSGFRKDERVDELISLGVKNFIQKPYSLENLCKAVQELVGK